MASAPRTQSAVSAAVPEDKQEGKDDKKNRLFVKWETNDEKIKAIFGKYGKIVDSRVVRGRCYGFVTYENEADANKAIAAMKGSELGSPIVVETASSERKGRGGGRFRRGPRGDRKEGKSNEEKKDRQPRRRAPRETSDEEKGDDKRNTRRRRFNRRNRRVYDPEFKSKDPNYGKLVKLIPDPIQQELSPEAKLTEVRGNRTFRSFTNIKPITSLALKTDKKKGAFKSDFSLETFELKLMQVKVSAKQDDLRLSCRIAYPAAQEVGEVYMRSTGGEIRSRNFLLKKPNAQEGVAHFLCIDRVLIDPVTGLWKELTLALCSATPNRDAPKTEPKQQ